jgi:hypothetical protein
LPFEPVRLGLALTLTLSNGHSQSFPDQIWRSRSFDKLNISQQRQQRQGSVAVGDQDTWEIGPVGLLRERLGDVRELRRGVRLSSKQRQVQAAISDACRQFAALSEKQAGKYGSD